MTAPPRSKAPPREPSEITTELPDNAWDEVWGAPDTTTASIGVLIFSRSTLVRCGLRFLLRPHNAIEVLAEAATPAEFVRLCADLSPPIVLVDLTGSRERAIGPRLLAELRRLRPTIRIIVLIGSQGRQELNAVLAAGVAGVVGTDLPPVEMVKAITQVSIGYGYFARGDDRENVEESARGRARGPSSLLSRREHQVLQLLAVGHTNSKIGRELNITESTVKFHMRGLRRKLGASGRAAIVYVATQQRLL